MPVAHITPIEDTNASAASSNTGSFTSLQFLKRLLARAFASKASVTGTCSSSGDNTAAIAAPGVGNRLVICSERWQLEAADPLTIVLKDGATPVQRIRCTADGDGFDRVYGAGNELRLSDNAAYVPNLSGAHQVGYSIRYYTESTSTGLPV